MGCQAACSTASPGPSSRTFPENPRASVPSPLMFNSPIARATPLNLSQLNVSIFKVLIKEFQIVQWINGLKLAYEA
jgi:hypothetical protein